MAWMTVPTGMLRSGRLLPGLMSAPGRSRSRSPCLQPVRRDDVALLAVGVVQQRDPRGAVGVVLDVRDLGRHAVLVVATEVDDAVGALVAAALVAGGDPAVRRCGRPCCAAGGPATSPASDRVISTKSATLEPRRPGVVGLYLRMPMCLSPSSLSSTGPPKMSMRSPSASVTIARLVSLRGRSRSGCACACPARLSVLTLVTLTPKTFSTAILISVLLASGRTRNVYLFSSSSP